MIFSGGIYPYHGFLLRACVFKLVSALLLTITVAKAGQYGDFTYSSDGTNITIGGYTGSGGMVTIPDKINGLPVNTIGYQAFSHCPSLTNAIRVTIGSNVTVIGYEAFFSCTKLTSVIMPSSVTNIGATAFYYCTGLVTVAMSSNLTSIGGGAFAHCTSLTNITIPSGVTNIGSAPLVACTALSNITVDAANSAYSSVDGVLFNKNQTTLIQCPGGKAGNYSVPNTVTNIGDYAFYSCVGLTSVAIPNSVTSIGDQEFYGCTSLTNITLPDGTPSIKYMMFYFCTNLTGITIPDSVTGIGSYAFGYCTRMTNVIIPDRVTSIGEYAFAWDQNLTAVFFKGNAPGTGSGYMYIFYDDSPTLYYLPGTTGWGTTFCGRPTAPWLLPYPLILCDQPGFGIRNNRFGFVISWATNASVVVEACPCLGQSDWQPLQTNALAAGTNYFSDPDWTNYSSRFYRIRSP